MPRQLKQHFHSNWPSCAKTLIWLVGSTILIVLTIRDFLPLYHDYTHKNVLANVAVSHGLIPRPAVTVCLPRYSYALQAIAKWLHAQRSDINVSNPTEICLECQAMADHGWDVWNEMDESEFHRPNDSDVHVWYMESQLAKAIIKKLLGLNESDFQKYTILEQNNFLWNQPIIDAIRYLFFVVGDRDRQHIIRPDRLRQFSHVLAIEELEPMNNRDLDRMFNVLKRSITMYTKFQAFHAGSLSTRDAFTGRRFSVDEEHLCFTTFSNSSVETYRYIPFVASPFDPPWIRYSRRAALTVNRDSTVLYSGGSRYQRLYITRSESREKIRYEQIMLSYSATLRIVESRSTEECSPERSMALCIAKRQTKTAMDRCGCVPFSYRHVGGDNISSLPYCNTSAYLSCEALEKTFRITNAVCNKACEQTFYSWVSDDTTALDEPPPDAAPNSRTFRVQIDNGQPNVPFVEITLTERDSLERFISQVGGIINLYLGVSGITICGFIITCMSYMRKTYPARKPLQSCTLQTDNGHANVEMENQSVEDKVRQLVDEAVKRLLSKRSSSVRNLEEGPQPFDEEV